MKKLLCVLLFGMVFGQDAITTREYTISITAETATINIMELIDESEGTYFINVKNVENAEFEGENCQIFFNSESGWYISLFTGIDDYTGADDWGVDYSGDLVINNDFPTITTHSSNDSFSGNVILHISGKFDDDVGLNGDMNDDGTLDVLDVVSLVQEILSGGMGDVGNLLNIVRG